MRARTPHDLGLAIRNRRRALKLRQQDLAATVGVSRQWIIDVEHGKNRVELGLVLRALEELGLELDVSLPAERTVQLNPDLPDLDMDSLIEQVRSR